MVGALATALLFVVGKELIGFYLGHTAVGSAYGAAASLVVLLIWLYYSSQILLFGAEFTKVWARRYGQEAKATGPARGIAPVEPSSVPSAPVQVATKVETRARHPAGNWILAVNVAVALFGVAFGWILARRK